MGHVDTELRSSFQRVPLSSRLSQSDQDPPSLRSMFPSCLISDACVICREKSALKASKLVPRGLGRVESRPIPMQRLIGTTGTSGCEATNAKSAGAEAAAPGHHSDGCQFLAILTQTVPPFTSSILPQSICLPSWARPVLLFPFLDLTGIKTSPHVEPLVGIPSKVGFFARSISVPPIELIPNGNEQPHNTSRTSCAEVSLRIHCGGD